MTERKDAEVQNDAAASGVRRRQLFGLATAVTGAAVAAGLAPSGTAQAHNPNHNHSNSGPLPGRDYERRKRGYEIRKAAADRAYRQPFPRHTTNGEEAMRGYLGAYTKGFPHNEFGEVDPNAYRAFLHAMETGRHEDFEAVPTGVQNARPQLNPQVAFAFDLQAPDSHGLVCPPAPKLSSSEFAGEMVENYWMALLRDVPFTEYENAPELVVAASESLSRIRGFQGPRQGGRVTPGTLFRGMTPGDLIGPYVSQFLLRDVPFGPRVVSGRQDTVQPGLDFVTDWDEYLAIQRGVNRTTQRDFNHRRYIQTPRDLAHYVHFDMAYQPYLDAAVILLNSGIPPSELLDPGNPYRNAHKQTGFATYGMPHLFALIAEADRCARKPNLFHQWAVHRRIRPEAVAARVEVHLNRDRGRYRGLLSRELLESDVLDRIHSKYGTYLLPQAFPEGSPMSPDYPSGHATVAGACVTILKAWFNEDCPLPNPVVPSPDGTSLVPYTGSDADRITIGGELNKLAANIGSGRNMGGVHWRSSYVSAFRLGEAAAIGLLRDQKATTNEDVTFTLTTFDGETIQI